MQLFIIEAKKLLPKPVLPDGEYLFYLTEKEKARYKKTLLLPHRKYLSDIKCEAIPRAALKNIFYENEWQVVEKMSEE